MTYGIDYDIQGHLYFSDTNSNTLYTLDEKCTVTPVIQKLDNPVKIRIDRRNNVLFVAEYGNDQVKTIQLE